MNAAKDPKVRARDTIPVTEVDQVFPTIVGHGSSSSSAAGAATGGDLGHVVNAAMRDVLGWRPRVEDPKAFVDALTASFRLSTREGHTEAVFVPRGYAVQADLGAVTGGQASLYRRAQVSRTEILRILDGLRPLRPDADADDMESYRTIVRGAVESLVDELGAAGGPRVQMVDTYFSGLTGPQRAGHPETPDSVSGHLGILRERFGLTNANVNTPDEEAVRTSFWTLVEMVTDLRSSWKSHRKQFSGSAGEGFLGTELIVLSRLMEAAADQVDEFEAVLESVMITASERRTVYLDTERGLTLDGLLRWLHSFLSEEGRRIAQDTGRDGIVSALAPTAVALLKTFKTTLADRVDDDYSPDFRLSNGTEYTDADLVRWLPTGIGTKLPAGMYAARSRIAIASLQRLLIQLATTAQRMGRFPGVVLLDVTVRPLQNEEGLSRVEFRGINVQENSIPAFVDPDRSKTNEHWGVDDYGTRALVKALPGTTSTDPNTIYGIFHTREIEDLLPIEIGSFGVVIPADHVPIAVIDGNSGTTLHAPEPTSWPSAQPSSRPPAPPKGKTDDTTAVKINAATVAAQAKAAGRQAAAANGKRGAGENRAEHAPASFLKEEQAVRNAMNALRDATGVEDSRRETWISVSETLKGRIARLRRILDGVRRKQGEDFNLWDNLSAARNAELVAVLAGGDGEGSIFELQEQLELATSELLSATNTVRERQDDVDAAQNTMLSALAQASADRTTTEGE